MTGTWFLGMTLILLVMDGTKSMAENALRMTSIGDVWVMVNKNSLTAFETFFAGESWAMVWAYIFGPFLHWPGWAVIGVPGLIFILLGQNKRPPQY